MYRILTLTDFSENSKSALEFSKILALNSNSQVTILHTITPVVGSITLSDQTVELNNILFENSKEKLAEIVLDFNAANVIPNAMIRNGKLTQILSLIIEELNIDMLVITTHGYGNPTAKITGKNAAYILANIHIPTIIIPSLYSFSSISNPCFAHQLEKPKLNHLSDFFKFLEAFKVNEIDLVHILSEEQDVFIPDKSMIQTTQEAYSDKKINFHFIEGEFVVDRLYQYLKENQSSFLVISSNKKKFWKRFISGNVHIERSARIFLPILILSGTLA